MFCLESDGHDHNLKIVNNFFRTVAKINHLGIHYQISMLYFRVKDMFLLVKVAIGITVCL